MRPFARSLRCAIYATSALPMLAFTPAAFAQDAAAPDSASAAADEDIIVTARRRDERLIDVPIAVTALSADTLAKAGGSTSPTSRTWRRTPRSKIRAAPIRR